MHSILFSHSGTSHKEKTPTIYLFLILWSVFILCQLYPTMAYGQEKELYLQELPEFDKAKKKKKEYTFGKEKLKLGGNLGVGFTNGQLHINISPTVGYRLFRHWEIGTGLIYQYVNNRGRIPSFTTHVIGGRLYNRVYLWRELYVHAEGIVQNAQIVSNNNDKIRKTFGNLFLGLGYNISIGQHLQLNANLLVNVFRNELNPTISVIPNFGIFYQF